MTPYNRLPTNNPEEFKRRVGLSTENFHQLKGKLADHIAEQKARNPLTKRGRNESKLNIEDRLLLTLYYIRHYPTFLNLAAVFCISESYCQKIYSRTARMLVSIEKLPSRKALLEVAGTLIIDASEQPIERPVKGQKAFYSGKKNATQLKHNL